MNLRDAEMILFWESIINKSKVIWFHETQHQLKTQYNQIEIFRYEWN